MVESKHHESSPAADSDDVVVALRTAQQHQVQLNVLADQKANINIGFTLFFVTLTQSQLAVVDAQPAILRAGFALLILTIATSLLLALIVVLPRTGKLRIRHPEQMTNPFYFGMFTQVAQAEYVEYLTRLLDDNSTARRLLAVDIYQIGQVLKHKYRLLRYSYGFLGLSAVIAVVLYCYRILA